MASASSKQSSQQKRLITDNNNNLIYFGKFLSHPLCTRKKMVAVTNPNPAPVESAWEQDVVLRLTCSETVVHHGTDALFVTRRITLTQAYLLSAITPGLLSNHDLVLTHTEHNIIISMCGWRGCDLWLVRLRPGILVTWLSIVLDSCRVRLKKSQSSFRSREVRSGLWLLLLWAFVVIVLWYCILLWVYSRAALSNASYCMS